MWVVITDNQTYPDELLNYNMSGNGVKVSCTILHTQYIIHINTSYYIYVHFIWIIDSNLNSQLHWKIVKYIINLNYYYTIIKYINTYICYRFTLKNIENIIKICSNKTIEFNSVSNVLHFYLTPY